jgi:putative DNA primase/helicase
MLNAMLSAGLVPDGLIADGEIHRVPVSENGSKKSGWYVAIEIRGRIFGTFGRWDTGLKVKHRDGIELTSDDIEMIRMVNERVQAEKKRRQAESAERARDMMAAGGNPDGHPYLTRKGISGGPCRVDGDVLMVPMTIGGVVVNVQRIYPDGSKKFIFGGRAKGAALRINGEGDSGQICVCEGYATGATISAATGYPVIVAFSAANLVDVAVEIRRRYPRIGIIICADNDKSGVGERYAKLAAVRCGGVVRMPPGVGTDFNDLGID